MKTALVLGATGFIGGHMVRRLINEGYAVRSLSRSNCDIRCLQPDNALFEGVDVLYNFACEVGGLGYIGDRANDVDILRNSTLIDLNVLATCRANKVPKVFFASSACVYNIPNKRFYTEADAYPANCSNEFAWQKIYAERLYQAYARASGIDVKIGRLFNTYGPGMAWTGGREKSVAALCRKIAEAKDGSVIEVWGSGEQTRSYTFIDDAVEGIWRLMQSGINQPLNIGPRYETTIRDLVKAISKVAGKQVFCSFGGGHTGVSKICSDNTMIRAALGWEPEITIEQGLETAYPWVEKMVLDAGTKT